MSLQQKVFIATELTNAEVQKRFAAVLSEFGLADSPESAEFIILDLSHAPKHWGQYVKFTEGDNISVSTKVTPCLFIETDGLDPTNRQKMLEDILNIWGGAEPLIFKNIDDLRRELQWVRCMLPFSKPRMIDKAIKAMALTGVKQLP